MEKKMQLSWEDIDRLAGELAGKITASGFVPDCLVGIAVGGLIPLALLSKRLGVRDVMVISASPYDGNAQRKIKITQIPAADFKGRNVLLIDEIADTGETVREASRILREACNADCIKVATFVVRIDVCKTQPDFFALEADRWVVFPWEGTDEQAR